MDVNAGRCYFNIELSNMVQANFMDMDNIEHITLNFSTLRDDKCVCKLSNLSAGIYRPALDLFSLQRNK